MEAVDLAAKPETERATLLCFYHYKEDGETTFTMAKIVLWLEECNFSKPNTSRLKEHLTKGKGKSFRPSKTIKGAIEFVPAVLQSLERDFGDLWTDTVTIESHDELIEEAKFCGKRPFLTRLMDSDGDLMMRMGDHMAMDMDTGDIHMISSWPDDDE